MKKTQITIIAVLVLLVGGYFIWSMRQTENNVPQENIENSVTVTPTNESMTQEEREETVREYITTNISTLSPEPEVLGGTFYVTDIKFTGENSGVVEYEDGHIALTADFTYSFDSAENPTVTLTNATEL